MGIMRQVGGRALRTRSLCNSNRYPSANREKGFIAGNARDSNATVAAATFLAEHACGATALTSSRPLLKRYRIDPFGITAARLTPLTRPAPSVS